MALVGIVGLTGGRVDLHKRELADAVDGVAGVVDDVGHTVAGPLQHQSAAVDASQVGALQRVEQSAGVDGAHTVELPVGSGSRFSDGLVFVGQVHEFVLVDLVAHVVAVVGDAQVVLAAVEGAQTGVAQSEVGALAVGQLVQIVFVGDFLLQSVVVGAVVGHVQLAVAVDERQVAAAVESAGVLGADGDEVAAVDVAHGGRHVAEDGDGVGIDLIGAFVDIAAGEDGIADGDAPVVEGGPLGGVFHVVLALQFVQGVGGHVGILGIKHAVDGDAAVGHHLGIRLDDDLAVFRPLAALALQVVIVVVGRGVRAVDVLRADAVDIADVAAAEDVAVAVVDVLDGAYLAAADVDLGLAEDVAVGIERAHAAQVVVALAAAEDIALHVAVVHLDVGLARLVGALVGALAVHIAAHGHRAAADGGNLAAAEEAVADVAAIHGDLGEVDAAVVDVAAAEDIAAALQAVLADVVGPGLVVQLLLVALVDGRGGVVGGVGIVDVADVAVVQRDAGSAPDGAALATGVGIALHGGHALVEAVAVDAEAELGPDADDDVRGAQDVALGRGADAADVVAHGTLPAAAIDIAHRAALDEGIGAGREAAGAVLVLDGAAGAAGIDVLTHRAAVQADVGSAADDGLATQAAAVAVVQHGGALVDIDVGIGLRAQRVLVGIEFFQLGVGVAAVQVGMDGGARSLGLGLPLGHGDVVEHAAAQAAAVDLVDLRAVVQVDGGVARPGVGAVAGAIDGGHVAVRLVRPDGGVDVDGAVERAAVVVVAAVEGAGDGGVGTAVVERALVDVAGHVARQAVGSGEEVLGIDGGADGHVDDGAPRGALAEAAAIGCLDAPAHQVDDGGGSEAVAIHVGYVFVDGDADAGIVA